jgi:hypothetical protein
MQIIISAKHAFKKIVSAGPSDFLARTGHE